MVYITVKQHQKALFYFHFKTSCKPQASKLPAKVYTVNT